MRKLINFDPHLETQMESVLGILTLSQMPNVPIIVPTHNLPLNLAPSIINKMFTLENLWLHKPSLLKSYKQDYSAAIQKDVWLSISTYVLTCLSIICDCSVSQPPLFNQSICIAYMALGKIPQIILHLALGQLQLRVHNGEGMPTVTVRASGIY